MQAPMQPSPLPQPAPVPAPFRERRSISHALAGVSLDLGPEHRGASKTALQVPYPSPPMSHSPPPLQPLSPLDRRQLPSQAPRFYDAHGGPIHHAPEIYRYPTEQHQTPFSTITSSPADGESFPAPFPSLTSSENVNAGPGLSPGHGRSPFLPQPAFTPQQPPRRPKSHVASACVNCKKAHLACDTRRPCPRCVGLGKQDTCVDVQHKKRGRPRLRDERTHSFEVNQRPIVSPLSSPTTIPPVFRTAPPNRVLKSQSGEAPRYSSRRPSLTLREGTAGQTQGAEYFNSRISVRHSRASQQSDCNATAYLTTEFIVARSTQSLRELLGYAHAPQELDGARTLFDLVLDTDREKVMHLYRLILNDRGVRDPKFLPPGPMSNLVPNIQALGEDVIAASVHGAQPHSETLHMRRPDGTYLRIRVRAKLAKTPFYFVVAVFSSANEMPPPLQLANSALSAPVTSSSQARVPTPNAIPQMHSPTFLASSQQRHPYPGESSASRSPYVHGHPQMTLPSPMESRPRTMQTETTFPSLAPYAKLTPSPNTSTFPPGIRSSSPPRLTPTGSNFPLPPVLQSDLQLPPLQLRAPSGMESMGDRSGVEDDSRNPRTPRRERIGVKEMLE